MTPKRLYLLDATAFCYRAFYALPNMATSFGQPTNAVYGFVGILNKIINTEKPDYLAVCFDVSRNTFRAKKFADYKIQRPPMPEGLSAQLPLIKQIVSAYRIAIFEKEGFEADDIIATLAAKAKQKGLPCEIVSSDKDILQLVDDKTVVFSPHKDEGMLYDEAKVMERFGVKPQEITDIIALMGDDVDNIPGVPGIGEKTAVQLIKAFGSLDKLLEGLKEIKQEKIRKVISQNLEKIKLSRELATLDKNVDLDFDLEKIKVREPDLQELFRLFKYLEFKKFLKELPSFGPEEDKQAYSKLDKFSDNKARDFIQSSDELVLWGEDSSNLLFFAKGKVFSVSDFGSCMRYILQDSKVKKIGHDLKKIAVSLAKEGILINGLYFDTMIAAYLLNPSQAGYALADLAWEYLGEHLGALPDAQTAINLTVRLKQGLENELQKKGLSSLFNELEMPLVSVLAKIEINGIKIDTGLLDKLSKDVEKRLIELIGEIYEASGTQFNINSPKQLRGVLFEKLKLPVVKRTKSGPSTDEEVLRRLAPKHKLPEILLEYRQLTKLKNTYIDILPSLIDKKTGRVHASFNQAATETGRLSSSNPNLQNIPVKTDIGSQIRKAIIASDSEGELLSCDYSQIELRVLAHLAKEENLIRAFKQDKDIHKATASLIYGLEEKDISQQMRENAKRVNFGIIYGLTSYGLSRDLGIPVEEAGNFIDAYFARYPKVKEYIDEQISKARKEGFVTTILGRRRYLAQINNKNQAIRQFAERQAVNTPIQGSASDLIKLAMIKIDGEIEKRALKSRMVLQIHDELVFDVPRQEINVMVKLVKERMEEVMQLDAPIRVDIKKGKNWLEMDPAPF